MYLQPIFLLCMRHFSPMTTALYNLCVKNTIYLSIYLSIPCPKDNHSLISSYPCLHDIDSTYITNSNARKIDMISDCRIVHLSKFDSRERSSFSPCLTKQSTIGMLIDKHCHCIFIVQFVLYLTYDNYPVRVSVNSPKLINDEHITN